MGGVNVGRGNRPLGGCALSTLLLDCNQTGINKIASRCPFRGRSHTLTLSHLPAHLPCSFSPWGAARASSGRPPAVQCSSCCGPSAHRGRRACWPPAMSCVPSLALRIGRRRQRCVGGQRWKEGGAGSDGFRFHRRMQMLNPVGTAGMPGLTGSSSNAVYV